MKESGADWWWSEDMFEYGEIPSKLELLELDLIETRFEILDL